MARLLLILSVLLALALPSGAFAGAVIPDTESLPWTDPAHSSPLEQLASDIASQIAGRPVRVYCNGQTDWDALARRTGFDGAAWWGYVGSPRYWYPTTRTFAESSTHMQLAPIACEHLWRFAKAEEADHVLRDAHRLLSGASPRALSRVAQGAGPSKRSFEGGQTSGLAHPLRHT